MVAPLQVYSGNKKTNVRWFAEIPNHWTVRKLKLLCHFVTSGSRGWAEHYRDDGALFFRIANLHRDSIEPKLDSVQCVLPPTGAEGERSKIQAGDLLISITADLGSVCVADSRIVGGYVSQHVSLSRPSSKVESPRWLGHYVMSKSAKEQLLGAGYGGTKIQLSLDDIRELIVPIPPLSEQTQIAQFLDYETARIDALIEKQQQLIELLKEKRQAVISHAVTKGLDPDAPMRDSGVEWLGKVPAHWAVHSLKYCAADGNKQFTDGDWIESPFITDQGVRLLQTGNVGIGEFKEQGFRYISEESFRRLGCTEIFPGNVLICRLDGPVGRACLVPDLGVKMITSVDNAILKTSCDFDPRYLVYTMTSSQWISWIENICRVGGGFRFRVSRTMLGDQLVPAPPVDEQRRIADYLDAGKKLYEKLSCRAEDAIELLQERRTALISAAVTGKIDVRNWKPPASEPEAEVA